MTTVHPARRRAERFDQAIEASSTAVVDPRLLELVELVGALREAPRPTARPAYVADLRSQLMTAAETDLVAAPSTTGRATPARSPRSRRDKRVAVALGGFAILGATTSMAVAAQGALPGDVLYPLKRAMEDADTSLATDDRKPTELLDHASNRLRELDELSRGGWDASETGSVESALTTFSDQASEASGLLLDDYASTGSEQSITELRTFTGESIEQLSRLEAELPDVVRPAVVRAAKVLFVIDQQAADACPQCAGLGITELPSTLLAAGRAPVEATVAVVTRPIEAAAPTTTGAKTAKTRTGSPTAPEPTAGLEPTPGFPDLSVIASGGAEGTGDPGSPSADKSGGGGLDEAGTAVEETLQGITVGAKAPGTPAEPAAPTPSTAAEIVQGAVDALNGITGTVTDPAKK